MWPHKGVALLGVRLGPSILTTSYPRVVCLLLVTVITIISLVDVCLCKADTVMAVLVEDRALIGSETVGVVIVFVRPICTGHIIGATDNGRSAVMLDEAVLIIRVDDRDGI